MADAPPVLRTLTITYGVDRGRLVVRAAEREHIVCRIVEADTARANLIMGELERWILYRVSNAATELADRLRSPAFSPAGPLEAPSNGSEKR